MTREIYVFTLKLPEIYEGEDFKQISEWSQPTENEIEEWLSQSGLFRDCSVTPTKRVNENGFHGTVMGTVEFTNKTKATMFKLAWGEFFYYEVIDEDQV